MGGTIAYTYDVLDNIQTVTAPGRNYRYCYDTFSNQLTFVRSNSSNCTDGQAVDTLEYDVQGNVNTKDAQTFTFDYGNRLREARYAGTAVEAYRYDGH